MNLIFSSDKQSSFEEPYIANTLVQLSQLRDSAFQSVTLENPITIDIVKQACRLLRNGGELNGELNEYHVYLLGAGLIAKDGRFIKQAIQVVHRRKPIPNSIGIYDYIEQRFITTNNSNPFENVKSQSEQIDEDELLNDNVQVKQVESCATKPRACANCTCGRKEQEDQLDQEQLLKDLSSGQVQSSCGSCYLGDAFRCANCPYRGLPAFKQGDVIQVNQNAQLEETTEDSGVTQKDGKVKLQL